MSNDTACTPPPQREFQVNTEFTALEKAQGNLSDLIPQLSDRLVSVMREPQQPFPDVKSKEETSLVPMAGRIRGCRHTVERRLSEIEDILDRLELP